MTEITRQHLGDAALAAGHDVACSEAAFHGTDDPVKLYGGGLILRGAQDPWRPHLDDGDAMRLYAYLRADISWGADWVGALRGTVDVTLTHDGTSADAARAAREAIVLCAAAVGRRMREENHGAA
jgi:hypothetical protein